MSDVNKKLRKKFIDGRGRPFSKIPCETKYVNVFTSDLKRLNNIRKLKGYKFRRVFQELLKYDKNSYAPGELIDSKSRRIPYDELDIEVNEDKIGRGFFMRRRDATHIRSISEREDVYIYIYMNHLLNLYQADNPDINLNERDDIEEMNIMSEVPRLPTDNVSFHMTLLQDDVDYLDKLRIENDISMSIVIEEILSHYNNDITADDVINSKDYKHAKGYFVREVDKDILAEMRRDSKFHMYQYMNVLIRRFKKINPTGKLR